jgi:polysaccharide export outer membrane protein
MSLTPTFFTRFGLSLMLALGVLLTGLASAQLPVPKKTEKKYVPYRITRGDRLSIGVVGEPELTVGGKRVEATGTINLLYISEIRLVGLTISEAQEAIARAYREGRFLRNPQVSVTVDEYAPRTVIVGGKVNGPGRQEIAPDTEVTIMDVISKANGFSETAKGTAVRLTRTMPDGTLKVFILDVESALKGRAQSNSGDAAFVVEPDDIIYVPEKII